MTNFVENNKVHEFKKSIRAYRLRNAMRVIVYSKRKVNFDYFDLFL